jgi:PAS domain S-box-containing protein
MVPVRTVLLVDDFTPDREQYKRWLLADTNYAYRIIETNCAADGLEVCRTEAIDAILLDYSLPDTNGLDFLEVLSAEQPPPPVVMITGDGNEAVAVRAMKLGAEDYLVKNRLNSELLQITMQSAIENAHLRLQLRQSDDRYRYLSGLIPQHVWVANSDGMMLDVNERWIEYTGLTLEQAKIQGWQAIVHPEDVSILAQAWEDAQMEGKSYQAEGRVRRVDGAYEWYLHQAMPLMNEQGQIIKWFGTATNIHDLKQIEADRARLLAEAEAAREEAEMANRSKDEFVAVVAHELRSPLNSIAGWAKLLQTRKFDEATQARALETIWRNTQIQVQLVEDLLDISRMVKGTLHLTLAPVNLASVIEAALDLVLLQAQTKQIRIDAQLAQIPQVLGDAARLQQIVVNLLNNALKFTPEQGQIEVQLYQVDSQAFLYVKDTGKGIAPEFLSEVFDQFRQGQQNTGSKDGLGLGLAIVKNLVHLHQGTVSAASEGVGRGATFTVCLPLLSSATVLPESM